MPASNQNNPHIGGHTHQPARFPKACFSFYLRDSATGKGLRGGLFELVSYEESGRNMALSNRYGKVSFCVSLGVFYALMQKTAPDNYSCNPNVFALRLENDGLFVNGSKQPSFWIENDQQDRRFSVVYHENGPHDESSRFSLSCGDTHKVAATSQAGVEKDGYAFVSWNQSPDGKGELYLPGDSLIVKNDIHLFAQWIPIPSAQMREASFFHRDR